MSTEISIKQLPAVTEINDDDLLLVQTANATNTLKFENFVVGLENTTFAPMLSANSAQVSFLSSVWNDTFFNAPVEDGPNILTTNTTSTQFSSIDLEMIPIDILSPTTGQKRTFYFLLSAGPPV